MKKVREESGTHDYKDAIELMFFSYRDFISDPDAILQKHGFGRAHHRVLHFVGCNPGLSIANLLDILRVTKQSLARILRDLIDEGYINQKIGILDRRKRLLFLTAKGHKLHDSLIAPQISRFEQVTAEVDTATFNSWKEVMRLMINPADRENVDNLIATSRNAKNAASEKEN